MTIFANLVPVFPPIELSFERYEFDEFGVFFDPQTRMYYTGRDAGCSCPTPWERHTMGMLTGPLSFTQALRALDEVMTDDASGRLIDSAMNARQTLILFAKANNTFPVE